MSKWKMVAIHEVAKIDRCSVDPASFTNSKLYIGLENIISGGSIENVKPVQPGELASNKFKFTSRHLLYGKLRPYLAKIARPTFDGICSTDILPLLPGPELSRAYLSHYLLQPSMVAKAHSQCTGANLPRLSPKTLGELEIPLPPLAEQKRIAAILDKADAIRRKRNQALKLADDFLRATFLDMFGDPVTNPMGWEVVCLSDLGEVKTGNTPSRKKIEYYGDSIEWIKSDNINSPFHYLTKAEEGLSMEGKAVARTVPPYSTLVTCIAGSFDCIGNAALSDREVAFNQQINAITPKEGTDPFFLYCLILNSKKKIQYSSTNSMKGMVSKGNFEKIKFYKPPVKLQREFRAFFEKYMAIVNSSVVDEQNGCELFNSLTQRAFRGEL